MTTHFRALILNNRPLIRVNVCFGDSNRGNQERLLCGVCSPFRCLYLPTTNQKQTVALLGFINLEIQKIPNDFKLTDFCCGPIADTPKK